MREHADKRAAKVFEGMGIYAPTLGIIGAVLGLMAVMQNLADPSKLGHGIAAAFTATVYGIGLANLFFLPIAGKLKGIVAEQTQVREMVIEGIVSIVLGENPRAIESKLQWLPALMGQPRFQQRGSLSHHIELRPDPFANGAQAQTRRARQSRGLGHSLRRPDHAAARVLRGDVRDLLDQRGQVPRVVRFAAGGIPRRAAHARAGPGGREDARLGRRHRGVDRAAGDDRTGSRARCSRRSRSTAGRHGRAQRTPAQVDRRCAMVDRPAGSSGRVADELEKALAPLVDCRPDRGAPPSSSGSKSKSAPTSCSRAASRSCPTRHCRRSMRSPRRSPSIRIRCASKATPTIARSARRTIPSNWELSAARAASVVHLLREGRRGSGAAVRDRAR